MIVWLIGLSGAGKTTIGRKLYSAAKVEQPATVFLDGDHIREIMGQDLGHSVADRETNGWRICRFCQYLDRQNITVICSILSLFPEQRRWNRENYTNYFEVFIDVSMDILSARDQKGLYSGARAGRIKNVAGFDIPFPPPTSADLVVKNEGSIEADAIAATIWARIKPEVVGLSR